MGGGRKHRAPPKMSKTKEGLREKPSQDSTPRSGEGKAPGTEVSNGHSPRSSPSGWQPTRLRPALPPVGLCCPLLATASGERKKSQESKLAKNHYLHFPSAHPTLTGEPQDPWVVQAFSL